MTIPNRTVSITGIFAADATTTIPASPVSGISYRDTAMTGTVIREGWAFKTIVDSSKFNQAMFEYSSVTAQVEKYGFLPWSNLTDYVEGSVCLGSNGILYQALQETGPSTTAYDPTTNRSVWTQIILGNTNELFDFKWVDHELIRQDWLRADTFSWQSGTYYTAAYAHLVADIQDVTPTTETVGDYTVTYYQAEDGHKIVLPSMESTLQNIYTDIGPAWYYILDTTNQRFKLPRTKYGFVGLRDTVGKYVAPGLPNITGQINPGGGNTANPFGGATTASGAFERVNDGIQKTMGLSNENYTCYNISLDASRSSSIYGQSTTVQPPATQMYLYFYIGEFSQSATEQTASLNATLFNGKVDLDFNNMNPSANAKQTIVDWGMPDYGSRVSFSSGSTTPSNGWLELRHNENVDASVTVDGVKIYNHTWGNGDYGSQVQCSYIPMTKSKVVTYDKMVEVFFYPCLGG